MESAPISAKALETFRNGSNSSEADFSSDSVLKSFQCILDAIQPKYDITSEIRRKRPLKSGNRSRSNVNYG